MADQRSGEWVVAPEEPVTGPGPFVERRKKPRIRRVNKQVALPSLIVDVGSRPFASWARRLPAWMGLLVVLGVVVASTSQRDHPALTDQSGVWAARVDGLAATTLSFPGLFRHQGLPSDARVYAHRDVTASGEPMALLIDMPLYAVMVTWDGVPVGAIGDPASTHREDRSSAALFVPLPLSERGSVHELGLDLRGDYGKGGIVGRILTGPVPLVHSASLATEVQRLAFALGLALLAALPLAVGARGAWRPAYVAYGLFASVLSLYSFAQSQLAYALFSDALAVVRALRILGPLVAAAGNSYVALFVLGRVGRPDQVLVGLAGVLAFTGLAAPPGLLYQVELLGEVLFVVGALRFAQLAIHALRARQSGAALLAASAIPVAWILASEITLTHGLRDGPTSVLASGLLLTVGLGAALVVRDAEASEQHERLVRGSIDAMVTVDRSGIIRHANPAARRMVGMEEGAPFSAFVSASDRRLAQLHLQRALTSADRTEFHTRQMRPIESLATPLAPNLLIVTLRDITVRREIDRGLLQAARMETVGLLLGGIAHDFNNMLSTLLAHLGLLRAQNDDPSTHARIDKMESAVDRASDLARRLLTVARGTGSALGPVDVRAVVKGAIELVEPTLPSGVKLVTDLPESLPTVLGAAGDLEQVVVNLLMNARDGVGGDGTVRVVVRPFGGGAGAAILVEDDGPGIDDGRKAEVFQPFVTTKPYGTGLGLAVAQQIMRDHQGRIWLEDRPGGGTRFVLALHNAAAGQQPLMLPKGRRVLLVEDEPVLLEDYSMSLKRAGFTVSAFDNGSDAAAWLGDNEPDIVVTDLVVPGLHGIELARASLALYPNVPVLVVSAFVPGDLFQRMPAGKCRALNKPVRASQLVPAVARFRRETEEGPQETVPRLFDLSLLDAGSLFEDGRATRGR